MIDSVQKLISGPGLRAQLLRGGVGSLSVKVAHALLAFFLAVVLARTLGPEGYGVYSFALAIIMLTAIPAQVGVPQLVVRETAKAQANGNYALIRGLWRWSNLAVAIFSTTALALVVGTVWFTDIGGEGARIATLTVGIALIPVIALANVRGACLRGLRKVVQGQLPESIIRPGVLLLLILIFGAWFAEDQLTPQIAMGLFVAAAIVAFAVGTWLLHRARPSELNFRPKPEYRASSWRNAVVPLAMIAGLQLINNYADIIILGLFWPDDEVGIYRAVVQFSLLVAIGFHIIDKVIQPYLAAFYEASDLRNFQSLTVASMAIVFSCGALVSVLFFVFGEQLLSLIFGPLYASGWLALAILSIGKLFYSCMGIAWHVLNMSGYQYQTFKAAMVAASVNVTANIVLIPTYGMDGAAIGTAFAFFVFFILLARSVSKYVGIRLAPRVVSLATRPSLRR